MKYYVRALVHRAHDHSTVGTHDNQFVGGYANTQSIRFYTVSLIENSSAKYNADIESENNKVDWITSFPSRLQT